MCMGMKDLGKLHCTFEIKINLLTYQATFHITSHYLFTNQYEVCAKWQIFVENEYLSEGQSLALSNQTKAESGYNINKC